MPLVPFANGPFETGAHTALVNNLILCTDNTRRLVEARDTLYRAAADVAPCRLVAYLIIGFASLAHAASKEPGCDVFADAASVQQYAQYYASRYEDWLQEEHDVH